MVDCPPVDCGSIWAVPKNFLAIPTEPEYGTHEKNTMNTRDITTAAVILLMTGGPTAMADTEGHAATFGDDLALLKKHTPVVVLSDSDGKSQVALAPAWQGRVMTSTDGGLTGASFGWINRDLIKSGEVRKHINPYGGEDRLWLGPEGGQFSLFFAKGDAFDLDHWQTPAVLDTEPFDVIEKSPDHALFARNFKLSNYSGTVFDVKIERDVRLLPAADVWHHLGVPASAGTSVVGYESANRLTNAGKESWTSQTGLLSIWILGMYNASPHTTVVIPIRPGDLGTKVNSDYFGPVPAERLVAGEKNVFFRGDGRFRSKIGITPARATPILGSYDAGSGMLTIVQFTLPEHATKYVNSQWKIQDDPFRGDVANSYSDDGKLGAFYEMESSSPAVELAAGKTLEHVHRTMHLRGKETDLDQIARRVLGVGLDEIKAALPPAQ